MTRPNKEDEKAGRIVAFLTRDEIDYIDSLAKDALFSTGHKLSRTDIIRAMIDAIRVRPVNGNGVCSKSQLEQKLICSINELRSITIQGRKRKNKINEYN
jgi:RNA-binding protein YlmH